MRKVFLVVAVLALLGACTSAYAFTNNTPYWLISHVNTGNLLTTDTGHLSGVINMYVANAKLVGTNWVQDGAVFTNVDTFCITPSSTLASNYAARYFDALALNTGASYLLNTYGAAINNSELNKGWNAGLQAAIWHQLNNGDYSFDNNSSAAYVEANAKYNWFNLDAANKTTGANPWTQITVSGFDGGGLNNNNISQGLGGTVPEPGTILAALSILGPAAMIFRRRKSA